MFDFRERIKEEKKRLNISAKSMAARSELQIQEETISRFLTGKTADPASLPATSSSARPAEEQR